MWRPFTIYAPKVACRFWWTLRSVLWNFFCVPPVTNVQESISHIHTQVGNCQITGQRNVQMQMKPNSSPRCCPSLHVHQQQSPADPRSNTCGPKVAHAAERSLWSYYFLVVDVKLSFICLWATEIPLLGNACSGLLPFFFWGFVSVAYSFSQLVTCLFTSRCLLINKSSFWYSHIYQPFFVTKAQCFLFMKAFLSKIKKGKLSFP